MELGEIGEENPSDRLVHARLLGVDAVVADVAEDLFLMAGEKIFRLVEQAFGFDEQQRAFGLEQIIHRVAEDFEFAGGIFRRETKCFKERLDELLLGGLLRFLSAQAGSLETFRGGDERLQFGEEIVFDPGLSWHGGDCARENLRRQFVHPAFFNTATQLCHKQIPRAAFATRG